MLAKDMDHLQLALLHNHVECIGVQINAIRILNVVIDEQAVRQSGAELKWNLTAKSAKTERRRAASALAFELQQMWTAKSSSIWEFGLF